MPKILFLDDSEERHEIFAKLMQGKAEVIHVRTYDEFRSVIDQHDWDLVCLDHDLGDGSVLSFRDLYSDRTTEVFLTGFDCAAVMLHLGVKPKKVLVHSWNPIGSMRIVALCRDAGIDVVAKRFGED